MTYLIIKEQSYEQHQKALKIITKKNNIFYFQQNMHLYLGQTSSYFPVKNITNACSIVL